MSPTGVSTSFIARTTPAFGPILASDVPLAAERRQLRRALGRRASIEVHGSARRNKVDFPAIAVYLNQLAVSDPLGRVAGAHDRRNPILAGYDRSVREYPADIGDRPRASENSGVQAGVVVGHTIQRPETQTSDATRSDPAILEIAIGTLSVEHSLSRRRLP